MPGKSKIEERRRYDFPFPKHQSVLSPNSCWPRNNLSRLRRAPFADESFSGKIGDVTNKLKGHANKPQTTPDSQQTPPRRKDGRTLTQKITDGFPLQNEYESVLDINTHEYQLARFDPFQWKSTLLRLWKSSFYHHGDVEILFKLNTFSVHRDGWLFRCFRPDQDPRNGRILSAKHSCWLLSRRVSCLKRLSRAWWHKRAATNRPGCRSNVFGAKPFRNGNLAFRYLYIESA